MAEHFMLAPLMRAGLFTEKALQGVTHVFDRAGTGAAGVQVMVAEHHPVEPVVVPEEDRQGVLPVLGAG